MQGADMPVLMSVADPVFVPRIHFGQITGNQMLVTVIENLKKTTISRVSEARVSVAASPPESGIAVLANVWKHLWSSRKAAWGSRAHFHLLPVQTGCIFLM